MFKRVSLTIDLSATSAELPYIFKNVKENANVKEEKKKRREDTTAALFLYISGNFTTSFTEARRS